MANLEQARCALMLEQPLRAESLYRDILRNPDAATPAYSHAQLEYGLLIELQSVPGSLSDVFDIREVAETSPVADAVACLRGDLAPEAAVERARRLPSTMRNDTLLAAAVAAHRQGKQELAAEHLRASITWSRPATEWPAPFARRIEGRIIR